MISYRDFAITAMFNQNLNSDFLQTNYPDEVVRQNYIDGLQSSIEKFHGYQIDYEESIVFFNKRREVYTHLTPYEHLLNVILNDGNTHDGMYFPEKSYYMEKINPSLTNEEYQSAFQFWKNYNYHLKSRAAIQSLVNMVSVSNIEITDKEDNDLNCIGFLGSPGNTHEVNLIISLVQEFQEKSHNLLWVPPCIKYKLGDGCSTFLASSPSDDSPVESYLMTMVGTIYPHGKPRVKTQFTDYLKAIK